MRWGFDGYGDEDSQSREDLDMLVVLQQKTALLLLECQCALLGIEPPEQSGGELVEYRAYGSQQESECTWIEALTHDEGCRWTVPQSDVVRSDSEEDEDELSLIEMYTSS